MKPRPVAPVHCDEALATVFTLLGKRWNGVIIGSLFERPARFGELAAAIPGITEAMLSSRLAELQEAGLVEREVLPGPPIASVYRLTAAGKALKPGLMSLATWAHAHGLLPERTRPKASAQLRRPSRAASAERR